VAVSWLKLDVGLATNCKVAAAGIHGRLVFTAAMIQHARFGHGGDIPAVHMTPMALKIEAAALLMELSMDEVEAAIGKCCEVGLLARFHSETPGVAGAPTVRLQGYTEEFWPQCSHCRKPNPDHRFSRCPTCRDRCVGAGAPTVRRTRDADGRTEGRTEARAAHSFQRAMEHPRNLPVPTGWCACAACEAARDRRQEEAG